jgi:AraC-like DNA-binding protein
VAVFMTTVPSIFFLIGPFAYFYVRSVLKGTVSLSRMDYLHFFAFILSFLGTLPFLCSSWAHKLELASVLIGQKQAANTVNLNYLLSNQVYGPINVVHTLLYSILNWGLLLKNPLKEKWLSISRDVVIIRRWLVFIISIQTITAIGISIFYLKFHFFNNNMAFLPDAHKQVFFASSGYAIFNIGLLFSPRIFYGRIFEQLPILRGIDPIVKMDIPELVDHMELALENEGESERSDAPAYFTEAYIQKIKGCMQKMINNKEFANPNFSLQHISKSCNYPVHHLTSYFNKINNVSFIIWRNSLRIQYAIQLINEGELETTTFETIAAKVGFSSQNTFIRAFKNEKGKSPREYHKSLKQRA